MKTKLQEALSAVDLANVNLSVILFAQFPIGSSVRWRDFHSSSVRSGVVVDHGFQCNLIVQSAPREDRGDGPVEILRHIEPFKIVEDSK